MCARVALADDDAPVPQVAETAGALAALLGVPLAALAWRYGPQEPDACCCRVDVAASAAAAGWACERADADGYGPDWRVGRVNPERRRVA